MWFCTFKLKQIKKIRKNPINTPWVPSRDLRWFENMLWSNRLQIWPHISSSLDKSIFVSALLWTHAVPKNTHCRPSKFSTHHFRPILKYNLLSQFSTLISFHCMCSCLDLFSLKAITYDQNGMYGRILERYSKSGF